MRFRLKTNKHIAQILFGLTTIINGSSGIWSDGYCEWYIDNLYALCVTICILACSYASTHLNTIEPFVGANYSF